jgi:hypothetical protein
MFDLEQSIAKWRKHMLAAGIKTPAPLEELEIHLREEIERQMQSGLNGQNAFEIASARIGQANSLKQEFQKNNSPDKVQLRRRAGLAFAGTLGFYSLAIVCIFSKGDFTFNERLSGFSSLATTLVSGYLVWRFAPRFFPVITNKRFETAIGVALWISAMSWLFAFVYFILPYCDFTLGQLRVAVFWAIVPAMALSTIATLSLFDKSGRQTLTTTSS